MNSGRSRRRSLRVPLDEVPRRVSSPELPLESIETFEEAPPPKPPTIPPPPRPRTVPPPSFAAPPQASFAAPQANFAAALDMGRATDPSISLPSMSEGARTTDPGSPLDSAELAASELQSDDVVSTSEERAARPSAEASEGGVEGSMELDAMELESEPTTSIALPESLASEADAASTSPGDALAEAPPPPAAEPSAPAADAEPTRESSDDDDEPALSFSEEPSQIIEMGSDGEIEVPPELAQDPQPEPKLEAKQEPEPAPVVVERLSQPGVILVQRTISIGVGAPTHTTTAKERESSPPPAPASLAPIASEPAFELSDSEIAPASDSEIHISAEMPATPLEAPAKAEDREPEELEELEEVDARDGPRSAPPPPPAAAPPPPPREAQRPPPPPKAPAQPAAAPPPATVPVDVETGKRTRKKWWEEFFNDDYFRTVPLPQPRTIVSQSAFIAQRLGLPPGSTILDVGCGLGLHAIELTRLGYTVVALDLSLPMLSRAADEAQDQGLKINFLQADMREMAFESMFDAVLCWGTTFGYFDDDQNRNVVERLHRALKPGGLLLLDVVNRDYVVRTTPNSAWFQGDGCVVMEETNCNYINSRLTVKRQVMLDDGRQNETVYTIRLYSLHELGQILHQRGFRVVEVSGREATPGVFFGSESPRLIIVAERRPDVTPSRRPEDGSSHESQQMQVVREPKSEPVKLDAAKDTGKHEAAKDPARDTGRHELPKDKSEPGRGE